MDPFDFSGGKKAEQAAQIRADFASLHRALELTITMEVLEKHPKEWTWVIGHLEEARVWAKCILALEEKGPKPPPPKSDQHD